MIVVGLAFAGFALGVIVAYFVMYGQASKTLDQSIAEVLKQEPVAEANH
jgi:hypothetical protein